MGKKLLDLITDSMQHLPEDIMYDTVGDILEYGNITDDEAVVICDEIMEKSLLESNEHILESMFHAVLMGVGNRNIAGRIHVNKIIENIENYSEEILDYIITILSYTGNQKYISTIQEIGYRYQKLDVDEALKELKRRG